MTETLSRCIAPPHDDGSTLMKPGVHARVARVTRAKPIRGRTARNVQDLWGLRRGLPSSGRARLQRALACHGERLEGVQSRQSSAMQVGHGPGDLASAASMLQLQVISAGLSGESAGAG